MADNRESEFGGSMRDNTLPAKEPGAPVSAQGKMRLMKLTGTEDITASPDGGRSWNGWARSPNSVWDQLDS